MVPRIQALVTVTGSTTANTTVSAAAAARRVRFQPTAARAAATRNLRDL